PPATAGASITGIGRLSMPCFIFAAHLLYVILGARPGRDLTDGHLYSLSLENDEGRSDESRPLRTLAECPEAKQQLEELGLQGDGHANPCHWKGIWCEKPCKVSGIVLSSTSAKVPSNITAFQALTSLKRLDLCHTQVTGDIAAFQPPPSLETLGLSHTQVIGDIAAFQAPTSLETLGLSQTQVTGDLTAFQAPSSLKRLYLSHTQVTGDIATFQAPTSLEELSLFQTQVTGDFAAFQAPTSLQLLDLSHTRVTGDLTAFQALTSLKWLYLSHTQLTGDIAAFQALTRLETLILENCPVAGPIATFQPLTRLSQLFLTNTQVTGNVSIFQALTSLTRLVLEGTQVFGDLAAFKKLTSLQRLSLDKTKVTGDISAFQTVSSLERLDLPNTRATGDITALQTLTGLQQLSLSNTPVAGDISALENLTHLRELHLSGTSIVGSIDGLVRLEALETAMLDGTGLHGVLRQSMWTSFQNLRELNLADSKVKGFEPFPGLPTFSTQEQLLPHLHSLNVSGCPLNGHVENLLLPLAGSGLAMIAASGCGLSGAVPDIRSMAAVVDKLTYGTWLSNLAKTLQVLDLSHNRIGSLASLPATLRMDLSHNAAPLLVMESVFVDAVRDRVDLWFVDTQLSNANDMQKLMSAELKLQKDYSRIRDGFACQEFQEPVLQVTPELFMPEQMCACRAGYMGSATNCSPCLENTYASDLNSPSCLPCPPHSKAPSASTSPAACACEFGTVQNSSGTLSCQCPEDKALVNSQAGAEHCASCQALHLLCPAGSKASTAKVLQGYARLQEPSEKVYKCLEAARCTSSGCAEGYFGRLCTDCEPGHRAHGGRCIPCTEIRNISPAWLVFLGLCATAMALLVGAAAWAVRRSFHSDLRWTCAAQLVLPQLAVLLQLVQLWSALGPLRRFVNGEEEEQSDAWLACLEMSQLTASELQRLVALQCRLDGAWVRSLFAIATPVVPLAMLLGCCFIEILSRGTGIQIGLKVLTVLFIGGAAGSAQLLGCQRTDGTGQAPLESWAFRPLFPQLLCSEAAWVDWLGGACGVCYGVLIPCFLAFLFAKQHLLMLPSKTFTVSCVGGPERVTLKLQDLNDKEGVKEEAKKKILVAAAAAYVAVHVKKRHAVVDLDEDAATVSLVEDAERVDEYDDADVGLSVDTLVLQAGHDASALRQAEIVRYHAMLRMLTERSILAGIEAARSDRLMLGAKQLLCKYGSCQFVWLEVCSKLASAALVSVVSSKDGLWLSVAITLGMALIIGTARPFVQPQVNVLQTTSFACLALAALGFRFCTWLSRVALAVPVLLLVLSMLRPDSQEALALRLHKELEEKLPSGPVKVSAEQAQFL
ncbi:unnamed protein product, partial [Durusdinium trenchii]